MLQLTPGRSEGAMPDCTAELRKILKKAEQEQSLTKEELLFLLTLEREEEAELLFRTARELRERYFQNEVFLYGFIYFSTWCRNDCAFCYYRRSNRIPHRYRKSDEEILEAAERLAESGVHLIDLTSGEDEDNYSRPGAFERIASLAREIKKRLNVAVMLSPGVVPKSALQLFAASGADWYACYQETHNPQLYERLRLHQGFEERLQAKLFARSCGMLVEEGILKGVGETYADVVDSFGFMRSLGAQQVRVMSFIPQKGTPMEHSATPDRLEELKVIAVMRILFPDRLIPASLDVDGIDGLEARLRAGANVITSLIPPKLGLAGVAQSARDIEEGYRTVQGVIPVLEKLGMAPAAKDRYLK
ncbi:MAG: methylornithine synthase PylB, partial [Thermacetogeniaceae bacterium]